MMQSAIHSHTQKTIDELAAKLRSSGLKPEDFTPAKAREIIQNRWEAPFWNKIITVFPDELRESMGSIQDTIIK